MGAKLRALESYINAMVDAGYGIRTTTDEVEKALNETPLFPVFVALQRLAQKAFVAENAALNGFYRPSKGDEESLNPFETLKKQNSLISEALKRLSEV